MSKPYRSERTNRVPWSDYVELIAVSEARDEKGYRTSTETRREVCCSFCAGASRAEYYEAAKAGIRVTASVELWEDDYSKERELECEGIRYRIGRVTATGRGTLLLYLEEVW